MKKRQLQRILEELLFEDVAYGLYDRPAYAGATRDDTSDPNFEPTVKPELPLDPTPMMANQLSYEKPPIEDEDYVPTSIADLQHAAATIAEHVPTGQIRYFYQRMHDILDDAVEKENEVEIARSTGEDKEVPEGPVEPKNETRVRIAEAVSEPEGVDGEYTLQQIADEFGYSRASGARQLIDRILKRVEYFAARLRSEDVAELQDKAVVEYIDTMEQAGFIDAEDVKLMLANPQEVKNLDSFRFFLVSAFILPSYNKISKDASNRLRDELLQIGVPKKALQTFMNQILGDTPRDNAKLTNKLVKSGLATEDANEVIKKVLSRFKALKELADPGDDLIQVSMDTFDAMSQKRKEKLLIQAMEKTEEYQQQ